MSTQVKKRVTQALIIVGIFAANAAYLTLSPFFPS